MTVVIARVIFRTGSVLIAWLGTILIKILTIALNVQKIAIFAIIRVNVCSAI